MCQITLPRHQDTRSMEGGQYFSRPTSSFGTAVLSTLFQTDHQRQTAQSGYDSWFPRGQYSSRPTSSFGTAVLSILFQTDHQRQTAQSGYDLWFQRGQYRVSLEHGDAEATRTASLDITSRIRFEKFDAGDRFLCEG